MQLPTEGDSREWQDSLKSHHVTLEKLIYKNSNQHRRTVYFRCLRMVQSRFTKLIKGGVDQQDSQISAFICCCDKISKLMIQVAKSSSRTKLATLGNELQTNLLQMKQVLSNMCDFWIVLVECSKHFGSLFAQGYFLPIALTILTLLSDVQVLVAKLVMRIFVSSMHTSQISYLKTSANVVAKSGIKIPRDLFDACHKVSAVLTLNAKEAEALKDMEQMLSMGKQRLATGSKGTPSTQRVVEDLGQVVQSDTKSKRRRH